MVMELGALPHDMRSTSRMLGSPKVGTNVEASSHMRCGQRRTGHFLAAWSEGWSMTRHAVRKESRLILI